MIEHYEHIRQRSFEDIVAAFKAELGGIEDGAIPREVTAAASHADFETCIREYESRSDFRRFNNWRDSFSL